MRRPKTALRLASRRYYWKPSAAWFRALELEVYRDADVALKAPVLDLGCGDGRVADMLLELGVLSELPIGVELTRRRVGEARATGAHRALLRADARRLPFQSASFSSVLCNGLLCSIDADPSSALVEIGRVVVPGGTVIATFPTDRFLETLLWSRLARFWPSARSSYHRRVDRRQQHYTSESPEEWRRRFEGVGLEVEREVPFLSSFAGSLWSVLTMQLFRFFGVLKLVPGTAQTFARILTRSLEGPYDRETGRFGDGYLWMMARKSRDAGAS